MSQFNPLLTHLAQDQRFRAFLAQPGVPAFPTQPVPEVVYLTPDVILEVLRRYRLFFQHNVLFAPMMSAIERALKVLERSGIITADGGSSKARCSTCGQRKLWAVALQAGNYFQRIVAHSEKTGGPTWLKLQSDLRAYLAEFHDVRAGTRVLLLARASDNRIKEFEL
jgi:hypothetical protein